MNNTLKTLKRTTWDKIKIGEVFACDAKYLGWIVIYKVSNLKAMDLSYNYVEHYSDFEGNISKWKDFADKLYKLPKNIQKLWKEE